MTPLVRGGQGRTASDAMRDAALVAVVISATFALLVWACLS